MAKFDLLREVVAAQALVAKSIGDIDLQKGADAMIVADVLFAWLDENVDDDAKEEIASALTKALDL